MVILSKVAEVLIDAGVVQGFFLGLLLLRVGTGGSFPEIAGGSGQANSLRIAMSERDPVVAREKSRIVEDILQRGKVSVLYAIPVGLLRNAIAEHMAVLVGALLAMAALMGVVGALGLLSTMSMNIMERTRELGVMRALGATPGRVSSLLVHEGITVGVMSMIIALPLSLLLSEWLGTMLGNMAFRIPLPLNVEPGAIAAWAGIVLAGSAFATLSPARRAGRMSTREVLSCQ